MSQPFQNFKVSFGAGETVFTEGEPGDSMFIVQTGRVELVRDNDGSEMALSALEKGDFFGEMSILEGMPRTSTARVVEPCELVEVSSKMFEKMIRGNAEVAVRMLRKLSVRLRESERKLALLTPPSTPAEPPKVHCGEASPAAAPAAEGPCLTGGDKVFELSADETVVGRYDPITGQRPDIDLTELDLKRSISRRHARIVKSASGYEIMEEIGALNGTSVDGTRLEAGETMPIVDGTKLVLGSVELTFRG